MGATKRRFTARALSAQRPCLASSSTWHFCSNPQLRRTREGDQHLSLGWRGTNRGREGSMAIETRISGETYERLALAEPDRKWELRDGVLREKPAMTAAHNWLEVTLGYMLMSQLDWSTFQVRVDAGRVRRPEATYFIPDVFVIPTSLVTPLLDLQDV